MKNNYTFVLCQSNRTRLSHTHRGMVAHGALGQGHTHSATDTEPETDTQTAGRQHVEKSLQHFTESTQMGQAN